MNVLETEVYGKMVNILKVNNSEYHEFSAVEEDASPGEDEITLHLTFGSETECELSKVDMPDRRYHHIGLSIKDAKKMVKWLQKVIDKHE